MQTAAQKLATLAIREAKTDLYTSVDMLFDAIDLILVNGTEEFDPKQVISHVWERVHTLESKVIKG